LTDKGEAKVWKGSRWENLVNNCSSLVDTKDYIELVTQDSRSHLVFRTNPYECKTVNWFDYEENSKLQFFAILQRHGLAMDSYEYLWCSISNGKLLLKEDCARSDYDDLDDVDYYDLRFSKSEQLQFFKDYKWLRAYSNLRGSNTHVFVSSEGSVAICYYASLNGRSKVEYHLITCIPDINLLFPRKNKLQPDIEKIIKRQSFMKKDLIERSLFVKHNEIITKSEYIERARLKFLNKKTINAFRWLFKDDLELKKRKK